MTFNIIYIYIVLIGKRPDGLTNYIVLIGKRLDGLTNNLFVRLLF